MQRDKGVALEYELVERLPTVAEFGRLRRSVGLDEQPQFVVRHALSSSLVAVCIEVDGIVVATGRGVGDSLYAFLVDILVDPAFRNRGLDRVVTSGLADLLASDYQAVVGVVDGPRPGASSSLGRFEDPAQRYFRRQSELDD